MFVPKPKHTNQTHTLSLYHPPLTLSRWPWAIVASGCCWDFCVGGWRADGERLGLGSHNFHPSIHPLVRLMNGSKVSPSIDRWLCSFLEFIYNKSSSDSSCNNVTSLKMVRLCCLQTVNVHQVFSDDLLLVRSTKVWLCLGFLTQKHHQI